MGVDVLQVTTHEHAPTAVLDRVSHTRVEVTDDGDVRVRGDVVRPCRLPDDDGRARVALVASPVPGGADVRIEVDVAAGRTLELLEITASGAHDVTGPRTSWLVDGRLGRDAALVWPSLPFVVAQGAAGSPSR